MTYDEFVDYQESLKKKRKIAKDGEIVVAPMAIMDASRSADAKPFNDDRQRMEDAYAESVRDLNAWRDQDTPVAAKHIDSYAGLSDADAADAAYRRSVDSLNA